MAQYSGFMTRVLTALLAGAFGTATLMPSIAQAQQLPPEFWECAAIEKKKKRRVCYDALAERARQTMPDQSAAAPGASPAIVEAIVEAPAVDPVEKAIDAFGAATMDTAKEKKQKERAAKPKETRPEDVKDIEISIVEIRRRSKGWVIITERGQTWRQVDGEFMRFGDLPAKATIKKRMLGAYYLRLKRNGQTMKVKRVR